MFVTLARFFIVSFIGLTATNMVFANCMGQVTFDKALAKEIITSIEQEHVNKDLLLYAKDSVLLDRFINNIDKDKIIFSKPDIQLINKKCKLKSRNIRKGDVSDLISIYDFALSLQIKEAENAIDKIDTQFLSLDNQLKKENGEIDFANNQQELTSKWNARIAEKYQQQITLGHSPAQALETVKKAYLLRQQRLNNYKAEKLFELAINGYLSIYDNQTKFIPENFMVPTDMNLVGLGVELKTDGDFPYITGVVDTGPARDVLSINDKILSISNDGREFISLDGILIEDAAALLRGKKGTEIVVIIQSDSGKIKPHRLIREQIKLSSNEVSYTSLDKKINGMDYKFGILKVPSFYMDFEAQQKGDPNYKNSTNDAVMKSISQLGVIDGLILDLRDNQGGAVQEARRFSGLFLDDIKLVELKSVSFPNQILRSEKNLKLMKKPTLVLINSQTAGAAEWVAAALLDNQYALVAGEKSYGLGTVSSLKELSRGRLQLPVAKVFRMNRKPLNKGVEPNVATTDLDEALEAFAKTIQKAK